ncbi:MAG: hypothetical protein ACETWG_11815 [Candidatus Neomarinimicrobiota bacterium]
MVVRVVLLVVALVVAGWLLRWCWRLFRAVGLLVYLSRGMNSLLARLLYRIEVQVERYPHQGSGLQPYKIYRPLARTVAPALVIYHGATSYGEEHPALDNLARALAHVGLLVFVPRLPTLKAVIIDKASMRSMSMFYRYIQGYEGTCPGRISVAGTSFAGGLLLKALLDQEMQQPAPRAVLVYGSYCDLETTLRFILTGTVKARGVEVTVAPDRWGQVIFFYNYLDHVPGSFDREAVRAVLGYYILDRVDQGDAARAMLPSKERRLADLILTPGNPESTALAEKVLQHSRPVLEALSPSQFYPRIAFPFWILHGRDDRMVPYTEALALKRLLPRQVRMHVSSLYSHKGLGNGGSLWRTLREGVGLVVYVGRFLRAVEG